MIKVLEVVGRMDRAGQETFLMNLFRSMDVNKYHMTFSVNTYHKGDYEEEIISKNGKVFHNPFPANLKNIFFNINAFRQFLRNNGPFDVVHCHVYYYSAFLLWAAHKENVPIRIMHSHNTSDGYKNSYIRNIYRNVANKMIKKHSTVFVACGKDAYKSFFDEECPNDKVILNNAVNMEDYNENSFDLKQIKIKNNIKDEKIFINVARFSDVKNHKKTLSIFKSYIENFEKNSILLLVGTGELMDEIKDYSCKLGIQDKVKFLGNRDDVNLLLLISDILVMPSKFEGLPVSLIEAQASGLSCVISSKITDEVDMGLNLINKVNLEEEDLFWAKKCDEAIKKDKVEFDVRNKILNKNGYTIESLWRKVDAIYSEKVKL